jgi:hypothetical protein
MTLIDAPSSVPAPSGQTAAPVRPRAKARGALTLGSARLECSVLQDGRALLASRSILAPFAKGVPSQRRFRRFIERLSRKIPEIGVFPAIEFDGIGGVTQGYTADQLVRLCVLLCRAARRGRLSAQQAHYADAAESILELAGAAGLTAAIYEACSLSSDGIASAAAAETAERQVVERAVADALRGVGLDDESAPATAVHRANAVDATRALDELVAYALEGRDDAEQIRPTVRACFRQEVARRAGVAGRRWGRWGAETHGAVLAEMRGVRSIAKACSRYPAVRRATRRGRIVLDGQLALNGVFVGTATAIDEAGR